MKHLVAGLAVVLTACSQAAGGPVASVKVSPSHAAVPSPSLVASAEASPSPVTSPTAIPFTDLPVTKVAFSCRLPVYTYGAQNSTIEDSFISFPSGAVVEDPNRSQGKYFDQAFSRWLPVPREAISQDGAHYAYVDPMQQADVFVVHIVDVTTGHDRSISESLSATGVSVNPWVLDYGEAGIYIVGGFEHIWPGVWLLDPGTGKVRKVADVERPEVIGSGGALWFGQVNAADPNPFSTRSSAGILPDEVGRFDLSSGSRQVWVYKPGVSVEVIGVDLSGSPLIRVLTPGPDPGIASMGFFNHSESDLLVGSSSTSQRSIYKGGLVETLGGPIADSHGVWFGSNQGIYLYSTAGGLQKVSSQPGFPANGCL